MNIHSAIKFGAKNNIKVSPSHEANTEKPIQESQDKRAAEAEQAISAIKESTNKEHQVNPSITKTTDIEKTTETSVANKAKSTDKSPNKSIQSHQKSEVKPAFQVVNLSVAGTPHRITCPADGVLQLERAGAHINDKIRELRRAIKGKNPTNEELLVLVCLELYDQCQTLKNERERQISDNEHAKALIEKIIKDARSVL